MVLQPAAAPAKAPQAAGPSSKAKVVLQPGAAPARAPQVAGPSSKAKLAEEGEVLGQEGVMHYRAVYHLADSPGGPMLDLKDLAKVGLLPPSHIPWLPRRRFLQEVQTVLEAIVNTGHLLRLPCAPDVDLL